MVYGKLTQERCGARLKDQSAPRFPGQEDRRHEDMTGDEVICQLHFFYKKELIFCRLRFFYRKAEIMSNCITIAKNKTTEEGKQSC